MQAALACALRDLAVCIGFFTRLPAPVRHVRRFADALWAAPLAGVLVGLAGGAAYWFAHAAGLPPTVAAALALAATIVLTGALHEDGLADTADGFGGGKSRARKLEIMRDSRIGTYGALALGLSLLLRWAAIAALVSPDEVVPAMIAAHAASRGLLPLYLRLTPAARPDGLGAGAAAPGAEAASLGLAFGALALLSLGLNGAVAAALCLAVLFVIFRRLSVRHIGGQTGDTAGALQQAAEMIVLATASATLT